MANALWNQALGLAQRTPATRHRGVDFLRAASIAVVVLGHWFMAAPWIDERGPHIGHMLGEAPWTQWLTWVLQVMPVFFFVGGYSNGITWDAAVRDGKPWADWLASRLGRLFLPVLPLLVFWGLAGLLATGLGVPGPMVRVASQVALVPTWFLAVYMLVVLVVPLGRAAWNRLGAGSIALPAVCAALVDLAYFQFDLRAPGWINYFFVWFAVHQLGFAWLDGRMASGARAYLWCFGGLAMLGALTEFGPWPRSMVGVPGADVSNTTPPHLPILALAAFQFGAVRILEAGLQRGLKAQTPWAATVLVNGMIMTVFLWHSTVMMLLFGVGILLGGIGLHAIPGDAAWWGWKVAWIALFAVAMLPVVAGASRWERLPIPQPAVPGWRQALGALIVGFGLALLAYGGVVDSETHAVRWVPLGLPFLGAFLAGMIGRRRRGSAA